MAIFSIYGTDGGQQLPEAAKVDLTNRWGDLPLTRCASIFLPLTLATGFFGMNVVWMTDRIGTFLTPAGPSRFRPGYLAALR